jgi:hypothetical protein
MDETAKLAAEEQQIRQRLEELQRELNGLQERLDEIARAKASHPKAPILRTDFRLAASLAPAKVEAAPPRVVPATSPEQPVDPLDVLRGASRGTALFAALGEPPDREIALLIRTSSDWVDRLAEHPDVEFRAGVFTLPEVNVTVVPVLVCIGSEDPDNLYEAWVNECGPDMGELLKELAAQPRLAVHLYGDGCRLERTLQVPNPLQAFAREALATIAGMRPLSADAFHQARRAVYEQHKTVRALWRALKG